MIDIVLFGVVVIVPLLLALLVLDVVAGSRPRFQIDDQMLASAGNFRDRPSRKPHHSSARGIRQHTGLGGAPAPAQRPLAQPDRIGSPAIPVAPNGPERLPAAG